MRSRADQSADQLQMLGHSIPQSRSASADINAMVKRAAKANDGVEEAKGLICEMCRNFYSQGWVSGTGGGMSIKVFPLPLLLKRS